eukprot:6179566-Pleurochrysis_carterae.AAC.1
MALARRQHKRSVLKCNSKIQERVQQSVPRGQERHVREQLLTHASPSCEAGANTVLAARSQTVLSGPRDMASTRSARQATTTAG